MNGPDILLLMLVVTFLLCFVLCTLTNIKNRNQEIIHILKKKKKKKKKKKNPRP